MALCKNQPPTLRMTIEGFIQDFNEVMVKSGLLVRRNHSRQNCCRPSYFCRHCCCQYSLSRCFCHLFYRHRHWLWAFGSGWVPASSNFLPSYVTSFFVPVFLDKNETKTSKSQNAMLSSIHKNDKKTIPSRQRHYMRVYYQTHFKRKSQAARRKMRLELIAVDKSKASTFTQDSSVPV